MTKTYQKGDMVYFGWNHTPNRVIRVMAGNSQYPQFITLMGPRGAKYQAFVRNNGTVRKI